MNWTGGKLQRSKHANRGMVQKQQAHFARVRTQLQTTIAASTPPIPSDFFRNEQVSLQAQLPLSSARDVRLTENGRTLQSHDTSIGPSPDRDDRLGTRHVAEDRPLHDHDLANTAASGNTNSRYRQDRSKAPDDPEESLVAAKRKRLLLQSDWAGLARPKPPVMSFKAQGGRNAIGKRRKTSHRNALTIREGPSRLVPRHVQAGASRQDTGGAHPNHDIRIRIGFEALTNGTSVQTCSQAHAAMSYNASSDNVLLADNALHAVASKPGQQADPNARRFVGGPTHVHDPRNSTRGATPRTQQPYYRGGSVASVCAGRNGGSNALPNDCSITIPSCGDHVSLYKRGEVSNRDITQQLGGIARPLRLTFNTASEFSGVAPVVNASPCNLIGESSDHYIANATVTETGHAQMETEAGSAEPRLARSIDDGPWMAFLPVQAASSSPFTAGDPFAVNRTHDRPPLLPLSGSADSTPWSQQATRGARTLGNVSMCVSPSLPSIARGTDEDELRKGPHMAAERSGRPKKQRDENDEFWQRIVFGSDKVNTTDGIPATTTSPCQTVESRFLSSVAVSRSSTPFDLLYGRGSCVSDNTQAAATRAPLVTSSGSMVPMITSSIAAFNCRGQAEQLSKESGDAALAEDSGFGLRSVTHTSMQNNVSYASDASCSKSFR